MILEGFLNLDLNPDLILNLNTQPYFEYRTRLLPGRYSTTRITGPVQAGAAMQKRPRPRQDLQAFREEVEKGNRNPKRLRDSFPTVCAKYHRFVAETLDDYCRGSHDYRISPGF